MLYHVGDVLWACTSVMLIKGLRLVYFLLTSAYYVYLLMPYGPVIAN